jgi:hypothetical protein
MIDLLRASALPNALVQSMAKGAIALPPREILEILVYLATRNPEVKEQAQRTLAGWNPTQVRMVVADPKTPKEVVEYFGKQTQAPRVAEEPPAKPAVIPNKTLKDEPAVFEITEADLPGEADFVVEAPKIGSPEEIPAGQEIEISAQEEDARLTTFLRDNEQELVHTPEKPFQPLGGVHEEEEEPVAETKVMAAAAGAASGTTGSRADTSNAPTVKKAHPGKVEERGSALQKINKLDVKGRITLALKGTKEERSLLIRDGTKVVAFAVLESPKITDGEVEKFASQKNVLESVLRQIPMKRRFAKNYIVVRNLVANPRTPLDVALGLMKNLLVVDLKNLSGNKEVSDTIRKLALKMFKQKIATGR